MELADSSDDDDTYEYERPPQPQQGESHGSESHPTDQEDLSPDVYMDSGIPHTPIQGHELLHQPHMGDESDPSGTLAGIRSQSLGKRLFQDVHSISTHLTTSPIMDVNDIIMEYPSHPSNIGRSQNSRDGSDLLADEAPRSPLMSVSDWVERLHGTQVAVLDIGHSVYHFFLPPQPMIAREHSNQRRPKFKGSTTLRGR